jgi:hypothetical protein
MSRPKIILFLILAGAGTLAMVLYAAAVAPSAPSSFQLAILVFTGIAAVVGFLGLLVSYLSYRMEAGRVPRPDIAIRLPDGSWSKHLVLHAAFFEPSEEFDAAVEERRRGLADAATQAHTGIKDFISAGLQYDMDRYRREVEEHLDAYRTHLEWAEVWDTFWRRSYVTVIGFNNEKAGVPASGIKVAIHFPEEEEGIRIFPLDELPDPPVEPERPAPPKPDASFGLAGVRLPDITSRLHRVDLPDVRRPGNVSGPEIGRGSVLVTYTVQELLHNTIETTEDDPIVLSFLRPGDGRSDTRCMRVTFLLPEAARSRLKSRRTQTLPRTSRSERGITTRDGAVVDAPCITPPPRAA